MSTTVPPIQIPTQPSEPNTPRVPPPARKASTKHITPTPIIATPVEDGEIMDNESDDDSDDSTEEDVVRRFWKKEPILLTVKNALVEFLREVDPSYGDLITFPVFQEFVRSHTSTLIYLNAPKTEKKRKQVMRR